MDPIIDPKEACEKVKPAEVKIPESYLAAKEEIVLESVKPGSIEYTVKNKTHFVSTVHITLKTQREDLDY